MSFRQGCVAALDGARNLLFLFLLFVTGWFYSDKESVPFVVLAGRCESAAREGPVEQLNI